MTGVEIIEEAEGKKSENKETTSDTEREKVMKMKTKTGNKTEVNKIQSLNKLNNHNEVSLTAKTVIFKD